MMLLQPDPPAVRYHPKYTILLTNQSLPPQKYTAVSTGYYWSMRSVVPYPAICIPCDRPSPTVFETVQYPRMYSPWLPLAAAARFARPAAALVAPPHAPRAPIAPPRSSPLAHGAPFSFSLWFFRPFLRYFSFCAGSLRSRK